MAVRTFSIKFLGEVADFQKKAKMAKSSLEDVRSAAESPGLTSAMGRMSNMGENLQVAGQKMQSVGGSLTKYITAPAVGAVAAVAGIAGALGFKRLVGIDTARAQFKGLGYDADEVMKQVDVGVTNTALSMAEGAAMATGILATGAVPMNKLQESIKRVANVSAAYNVEASTAGNLLNQVLTKNKVTYGDLSQMQRNGIPIISQLAKHYGVAGDAIMKMAQDGEISIEDFNKVIDQNAGKAAEEYGKSWAGVTANIKSNLGKIGAKVLGAGFETVKEQAAGVLETLRSADLSDWAERIGVSIGETLNTAIGMAKRLMGWWDGLSSGGKKFAATLAAMAVAAGPVLIVMGKLVTTLGTVMTVVPKLVGAFSLIANPVGLAVVAVAALVAGLGWFFTQTEIGQGIVSKAWSGIKNATAAVVDWWTGSAVPAMDAGWKKIQSVAAVVGAWYTTHLGPVFSAFGELFKAIMERISQAATWLWDTKLKPVFSVIGAAWSLLWNRVKADWDRIGPPLMTYIGGVFTGMWIVVKTIWNSIKIHIETVLGVIKGIIQAVTAAIRGDWSGAWEAIKRVNKTIIDGISRQISNVFTGVKDFMGNIGTTIKNMAGEKWGQVRDVIVGVVKDLKSRVVGHMDSVATGVGRALDKVKGAAAKPINFVINTVWNNGLRKVIGMIPGVKEPGRVTPIKGYAGGGVLPGHSRVYDGDDQLVPMRGGEGVTVSEALDGHEHRRLLALNRAVLSGVSPQNFREQYGEGYARGGRVHPISSGIGNTYPRHTGRDFPAPKGTPVRASGDGIITKTAKLASSYGWHIRQRLDEGFGAVYAHLSSIAVRAGQRVTGGQRIGGVGTTGNSTGNHLHFGINESPGATAAYLRGAKVSAMGAPGAASGPSLKDLLNIPGKIAGIIGGIQKNLNGPWGGMIKSGVMDAVGKAKDWMLEKVGIGGYKNGVRNARKGLWWAGENGPELINGNGGETVIPNGPSMDLAAQVVGKSSGSRSQSDVDAIFERLIAAMESREPTRLEVSLDEGDIRRVVRSELRNNKTGA